MPLTRATIVLGATAALTLAACTDPNTGERSNARTGALAGAAVGGLFGLSRDGDAPAETIIGAAVGAAIGGAIGNEMDKQAAELRRDIGGNGTTVVNTGNELVVTMPQDILFDVDSAYVRPGLRGDLAQVAANLNRYPDTTVDVVGHTDNTGSAAHNQRLSANRANAVAQILLANGVNSGRVRAIGRGEDVPVASNLTVEGRQQNRRVEIIIRPR